MCIALNLYVFKAFGNDLEGLIQEEILPFSLKRLDSKTVVPSLMNNLPGDAAHRVGEVLRVPKPVDLGAAKIHGARSEATDISVQYEDLRLSYHLYQSWKMSDREASRTREGVIPSAFASALDSLAVATTLASLNELRAAYNYSGKLDSTNPRTKEDLINAKVKMDELNIGDDRRMVVCSQTEGDLLKVFTSGHDQKTEIEGHIGKRFGFDIYSEAKVKNHKSGTACNDDGITIAVKTAVGSKILVVTGATDGATLKTGDILTVGDQSFAVAEDVILEGGQGAVVLINPVITVVEAGTSVTASKEYRGDVAFTKDAVWIAYRKLDMPENTAGTIVSEITNPENGMTLRVLTWYDPESEERFWKVEVFFGIKAVAPERILRMGGH